MKITHIYHSGFLVETGRFYYLFDYEKGSLPELEPGKPVFVLCSHSHADHYNPEIFSLLAEMGVQCVRAVLSDDIEKAPNGDALFVAPGMEYGLEEDVKLITFRSTDLGVAFLLQDQQTLIYHAGDLNDWVWDEESDTYNKQMSKDYRKQIDLLAKELGRRELDVAFVVLDPRQEKDYHRGMCYFLGNVSAKQVYPMHYWGNPGVIETFLKEHPQYKSQIQKTE